MRTSEVIDRHTRLPINDDEIVVLKLAMLPDGEDPTTTPGAAPSPRRHPQNTLWAPRHPSSSHLDSAWSQPGLSLVSAGGVAAFGRGSP